jgi:hypothetical protein
MLAFAAARFACYTGAGAIGASFVGAIGAAVTFGMLSALFATLRSPIRRFMVALIYSSPAALGRLCAGAWRDPRGDFLCNLATDLLLHRRGTRWPLGADAIGRLEIAPFS